MTPFSGAKIVLLCEDQCVLYLRDDKPDIPWPGHWDFPGGGREGDETPDECVLRETEEEFGIRLQVEAIIYRRHYPSSLKPGHLSWFMVARITEEQIAAIKFGDEGQYWEMVAIEDLPSRVMAPYLHDRFREYLATLET